MASDRLKTFLREEAQEYDPDSPRGIDPYNQILEWATSSEHGGLPVYAAQPFANWLNNAWSNFTEEPVTVKELLEGAVTDWCGGRTF